MTTDFGAPRRGGRILAVDDEPSNLMVISAALEPCGYVVRHAGGAATAVAIAEEWPPDLVLLDVMMPGESGIELCRRLRSDARFDTTPIVLVTALGAADHRSQGLIAGADDYLEKPLDVDTLVSRAGSWLARGRSNRPDQPGPEGLPPAEVVLGAALELVNPESASELAVAMAFVAGREDVAAQLSERSGAR